jgi:hypothetical protein
MSVSSARIMGTRKEPSSRYDPSISETSNFRVADHP